jgi:diaminopimelate decarboxylase
MNVGAGSRDRCTSTRAVNDAPAGCIDAAAHARLGSISFDESSNTMTIAVEEILSAAVHTPCYVYAPHIVARNYVGLRNLLGTKLLVSVEANPHEQLLSRISEIIEDGVEIASLRELLMMDALPACQKFVNNPAMTEELMRTALQRGASLVIDSLSQIDRLRRALAGRTTDVILRLNAASVVTSLQLKPRAADHFGVSPADAVSAAVGIREMGCGVRGLHISCGPNSFSGYALALARAIGPIATHLEDALGKPLGVLNLGGGFPTDWERISDRIREYAGSIEPLKERWDIFHESGRALFASAGVFVTKVIATKYLRHEYVVVCDGGVAQNVRLGESDEHPHRPPIPTLFPWRSPPTSRSADHVVRYVGNSCSGSDVIGFDPAAPTIPTEGDLCVFYDCGAYTSTFTGAHFLTVDPPGIYLA